MGRSLKDMPLSHELQALKMHRFSKRSFGFFATTFGSPLSPPLWLFRILSVSLSFFFAAPILGQIDSTNALELNEIPSWRRAGENRDSFLKRVHSLLNYWLRLQFPQGFYRQSSRIANSSLVSSFLVH